MRFPEDAVTYTNYFSTGSAADILVIDGQKQTILEVYIIGDGGGSSYWLDCSTGVNIWVGSKDKIFEPLSTQFFCPDPVYFHTDGPTTNFISITYVPRELTMAQMTEVTESCGFDSTGGYGCFNQLQAYGMYFISFLTVIITMVTLWVVFKKKKTY